MNRSQRRRALIAGGVTVLAVNTALAQQPPASAGTSVEEVVVTGSFIRRSSDFTPASPVDVLDREQLEAKAPLSLGEFLAELPYNTNAQVQTGRIPGATVANGGSNVNLRNLGRNSTLILVNGRRTAKEPTTLSYSDVNSVLPQIMLERTEVLKDGASALYGSDAVAGVVNFITRRGFDGFELTAQDDMKDPGGQHVYRIGALWGADGENTDIQVAAEYFHRPQAFYRDMPVYRNNPETAYFFNAYPGASVVPNRNAQGALLTTTRTVLDPACGLIVGTRVSGTQCQADLIYPGVSQSWEERSQARIELQHEFSSHANFYSELGYMRSQTHVADSGSGTVSVTPAVVIPGYAPSNTFRAVAAGGVPLFAVSSGRQLNYDKNGDGVNEFIPARAANGTVMLNLGVDGIPGTADDAVGGVPFWEDISIAAGSRIIGHHCGLPGQDPTKYPPKICAELSQNESTYLDDIVSVVGGFEGDIVGSWQYDAAFTYNNYEERSKLSSDFWVTGLRRALYGYGGGLCNAQSLDALATGQPLPGTTGCEFFNPFGSAISATPGSALANTMEGVEYVSPPMWDNYGARLMVGDVVFTGELFQLPTGAVAVAIGGQARDEAWEVDFNVLKNLAQTDVNTTPAINLDVNQRVYAAFLEVDVPLFKSDSAGSLDLNGAVRYEKTGGNGLETTDPKFGLLYSTPGRLLAARATWGTSFQAPTLNQRFTQRSGFSSVTDPRTNVSLSRVLTDINGNPALEPQTSEAYNLGITVTPLSNLKFDLDYWHYKFEDLVAQENAQAIVNAYSEDPTRVQRDNNGGIIRILTQFFNAASVETAGFDLGVTYSQDIGRLGRLTNSVLATYVPTYDIQALATSPVVDASDSRNSQVSGSFVSIDWRGTLRTTWSLGSHSVQSLLTYTDGFNNDLPAANGTKFDTIESHVNWDLSYTYRLEGIDRFGVNRGAFSLGVTNVMKSIPPYVGDGSHLLATVYDYSGRHVWGRFTLGF
jgi:iron complex outermembrane recepter protein